MGISFFETYLKQLQYTIDKGDAREETYYDSLKLMLLAYAGDNGIKNIDVTILPKKTEAGNPDFRVWNGKNSITGYIEAKKPEVNLDPVATSEQLKRYLHTFPNVILTNFYEFRLYQEGIFVCGATIAYAGVALSLQKTPPLQQVDEFTTLLHRFFAYKMPAITSPKALAVELAKRTRFLRDQVIIKEIAEEERLGKKVLLAFYESFKEQLISHMTQEQFADLYSQTLTYGIFAARTRAGDEFNRELIYKYIPSTLGVLKSIFKFISYEEPSTPLMVLIDDITDLLCVTDIKQILHKFYQEGKGEDPIIHFYETFLSEYDPALREKRGVYYTPEPVVKYIVSSIHSILKSHFGLADGLADNSVTLLDPAAGTLTFPALAIKTAVEEHRQKYGDGGINQFIKKHILLHFYALELMMAPYTVGHLKIGYLLGELGYNMDADERFKLYLTNTLEEDKPPQRDHILTQEIAQESKLANKVKKQEPVLVILGNPPYSGASENTNSWTEQLLKKDVDGATSYYKVDGLPLNEKNPKWLQDDYVKFIRFAQWKIQKAGRGLVGLITNHSYIDNPTFRGMRNSLLSTFDQIYILDLHGNGLKKEKALDGSKDENVFDIKQGVAIVLMIKQKDLPKGVFHHQLFGLRADKYDWLNKNRFTPGDYAALQPYSPFYLLKPGPKFNANYQSWLSITNIFPINSVGIVTARDALTIQDSPAKMLQTVTTFANMDAETARAAYQLGKDARDWKVAFAQKDLKESELNPDNIQPILYRPFDVRYTYYTGKSRGFLCMPRGEVMRHMLQDNVAICVVRQVKKQVDDVDSWQHVFIAGALVESCIVSNATSEISAVYPLIAYDKTDYDVIVSSTFNYTKGLLSKLGLEGMGEDLFYYIYAVLYSNTYRTRYAAHLKQDFPHIPITTNTALLKQMAVYGRALASLHLLTSPELNPPVARYQGSGNNDVVEKTVEQITGLKATRKKPKMGFYDTSNNRVVINDSKYFEGVTPELWNFYIGGYRVLEKYLADREGKPLEDPVHYCRMVTALAKTIEYQAKIDAIYDEVEATAKDCSE